MAKIIGDGVYFFEMDRNDSSSCLEIINFALFKTKIKASQTFDIHKITIHKTNSDMFMKYHHSNTNDIFHNFFKYLLQYHKNMNGFFEFCIPYKEITKRESIYDGHCNCELTNSKNKFNVKIFIKR